MIGLSTTDGDGETHTQIPSVFAELPRGGRIVGRKRVIATAIFGNARVHKADVEVKLLSFVETEVAFEADGVVFPYPAHTVCSHFLRPRVGVAVGVRQDEVCFFVVAHLSLLRVKTFDSEKVLVNLVLTVFYKLIGDVFVQEVEVFDVETINEGCIF